MFVKLFILLGGLNFFSVGDSILVYSRSPFVSQHEVLIRDSIDIAANKLDNCTFFKTQFPNEYNQYVVWRFKDKTILFTTTDDSYACANVTISSSILRLNPDSIFDVKKCKSLVSVLAHEILHLADLPNHSRPTDDRSWKQYRKEMIPTIQRECTE